MNCPALSDNTTHRGVCPGLGLAGEGDTWEEQPICINNTCVCT